MSLYAISIVTSVESQYKLWVGSAGGLICIHSNNFTLARGLCKYRKIDASVSNDGGSYNIIRL